MQCIAHGSCHSGVSRHLCDLPISCHMSFRNTLHCFIDSLCRTVRNQIIPRQSDLSLYPAKALFSLAVSESLLSVLWLPCLLPEDALQWCPAEASPDKLNFDGSSDNLCEENHTCQVASLPAFILLALSISHHLLTTNLRHLRQI